MAKTKPRIDILPAPPLPPGSVDGHGPTLQPSPEWAAWIRHTFIEDPSGEPGPLTNPAHKILRFASFGVLIASEPLFRKGARTVGTAQLVKASGDTWASAQRLMGLRLLLGMRGRFGIATDIDGNPFPAMVPLPTFVITLDARWLAHAPARSRAALIEHELLHCGQERGPLGLKFTKDGAPVPGIVPHDIEEFSGIIERYGSEANDAIRDFIDAAQAPAISDDILEAALGQSLIPSAHDIHNLPPPPLHGVCGQCGSLI